MADQVVSHISDTARWVAAYRAMESERPDALFHDPFARRLAGEHGFEIARRISNPRMGSWPLVTRTRLTDDLVLACIAEGADRVLNLAAGLDTRPYRLKLPPSLVWIEADLPGMIEEKTKLMAADKPVCDLRREAVDLSDASARGAFLDRSLAGAKKVLVLVEGLLIYLPDQLVRDIAQDLHSRPAIHWWMIDLASSGVLRIMRRRMGRNVSDDAKFVFAPANGVAFFAPLGWKARDAISMFHAAGRFHRLPFPLWLFARFKEPPADNPGRRPWSAVVRFERA